MGRKKKKFNIRWRVPAKWTLFGLAMGVVIATVGSVAALNGWFGGGGSIPEDTMTRGLLGYWGFEESSGTTAHDASNYANTGILKYMATGTDAWTKGKVGGALSFDGSDDYVDLGSGSQWTFGTGDFSAELWMYTKNWSNYTTLISNSVFSGGEWNGIMITQESQVGFVEDSVRVDIAGTPIRSSLALSENTWYHIVLTRNSGTAYIYVNGTQTGSGVATGNTDVANNMLVGKNPDATYPRNFNGLIDEVRVYGRALSADEVRYHYNRGGPVAQWEFNEGSGVTAYDSTDNNNDGSIKSSALRFDGVDDYVAFTPIAYGAYTFEFWYKFPTANQYHGLLGFNYSGTDHRGMEISTYHNALFFYTNETAPTSAVQFDYVPNDTNWHHLVFYFPGGNPTTMENSKLYIDGVNYSITSSSNMAPRAWPTLTLGYNNADYSVGLLDEFRIYNRELSADEAAEHYRGKFTNESGLVLYVPFKDAAGGKATDYSGQGNNGTLNGYSAAEQVAGYGDTNTTGWAIDTSWQSGKQDTALSFGGADGFFQSDNSVGTSTSSFSKSLWFRSSDGSYSIEEYLLTKGDDDPSLHISSAGRVVVMADNATTVTSIKTVIDTAWHYAEITADGSNIKLYLDGVLEGSAVYTGSSANAAIATGAHIYRANFFNGYIDEVKTYNYARSADEIRLDYNAGFAAKFGYTAAGCQKDPASCMTEGLVGYWDIEEGSGVAIHDRSDSSNNGTTTNMTTPWTGGIVPLSGGKKGGSALSFDDTDDYISVGDVGSVKTMEFWLNDANANDGILEFVDDTNYVSISSSAVSLTGFTNSTIYVNGVVTSNLASGWNHVVVTADAVNAASFRIGEANSDYLSGKIDEVRIYNRALSPEEVRYHYNRGGPMGQWKMDEGEGRIVYDSTENNNDGVLILAGSATSSAWVSGKFGSALSFDGTDDYVYKAVSGFRSGDSQGTVTAWLKLPSGDTGQYAIFSSFDEGSSVTGITWSVFNGKIRIWQRNNEDTIDDIRGNTTINDGNWHFVVYTSNGANYTFFIDGKQEAFTVSSGTNNGDWFSDTSNRDNLIIGALKRSDGVGWVFNGLIDDVRVYNYARTQEEIRQDYNAGLSAKLGPSGKECKDDPASCMTEGLAGYWPFDSGSGSVAYDASDNSNNGILTWMTTSTNPWTGGIVPLSGGKKGGSALSFDGTDDYISALNVGNVRTVEFWLNDSNATDGILELIDNSTYVSISSSAITATGFTSKTIYVNGSSASASLSSGWNHVVITDTADVAAASFKIGEANSDFMAGILDEVKIYNRALSVEEIRYHYNRGGPVAHWKMDEGSGTTVYDSTNNNKDATMYWMSTSTNGGWAQGKYGSALSFDGSDDYVITTNNIGISGAQARTLSYWVKLNSAAGAAMVGWGSGCGGTIFAPIIQVNWYLWGCAADWDTGVAPIIGAWVHSVITYDGTKVEWFINGASIGTFTYAYNTTNSAVLIGNRTVYDIPLNGLIDDVRIYNYVRTSEQIRQDYNQGLSTHLK